MNKNISTLVLTATLSAILAPLGYAKGALLPMEYYTPSYPIKSMGSRVLMGTEPEIDGSGQFTINSSRIICGLPLALGSLLLSSASILPPIAELCKMN